MTITIQTATLVGVQGVPVTIEVDLLRRLPATVIVGLPDAVARETADRVRAAIVASGFEWPKARVVVNLRLAGAMKKGESSMSLKENHYDLPIALAILAASGQLPAGVLDSIAALGELSLDGTLQPLRGVMPLAEGCVEGAVVVVPEANGAEARWSGRDVRVAGSLREIVDTLRRSEPLRVSGRGWDSTRCVLPALSMGDVCGQPGVKAALARAVGAGRPLLMVGPLGSGKSMLAARVPSLMPPTSHEEALEVTRIASAAGLLRPGDGLVTRRPFRAPHHSVSVAGLIGGANLLPGEVTLAHRGVLFLDELPEFGRAQIEAVGVTVRRKAVTYSRAYGAVRFPADFLLVAACNPCPCGFAGHPTRSCVCSAEARERYNCRLDDFCRVLDIEDRIEIAPLIPASFIEGAAP